MSDECALLVSLDERLRVQRAPCPAGAWVAPLAGASEAARRVGMHRVHIGEMPRRV